MYNKVRMYEIKNKIEDIINDWRTDLYVELQNQGIDIDVIKDLKIHLTINQDKFKTNIEENEKEKNKLDQS